MKSKKLYKKYFFLLFFVVIFFLLNSSILNAALLGEDTRREMVNQNVWFMDKAGFNTTTSVGSIVATVIQAFLGLLGIIFIILILYAGYNWMTAAGEEEKINKAKDTIRRAIIGLIIIIAAYSITYFVFSNLEWSGGGSTGGSTGSPSKN